MVFKITCSGKFLSTSILPRNLFSRRGSHFSEKNLSLVLSKSSQKLNYRVFEVIDPTREQIDMIRHFRIKVWKEATKANEKLLSSEIWTDTRDFISRHWVVLQEGALLGAARLTVSSLKESRDGHIWIKANRHLPEPVANFTRLVVSERAQGHGLATTLNLIRKNAAKEMKAKSIIVTATNKNAEILLNLGFTDIKIKWFDKDVLNCEVTAMEYLFQNENSSKGIALAHEYQNNSKFQSDLALKHLNNFEFNDSDKVLDVGCGTGKITDYIASKVPHGNVIGLDISENMVALASSHYQKENLKFVQGSATEIPFTKHFDKVVSFSTLHWVIEQEKALKSIKDSLKPGGKMLLVFLLKSPNTLTSWAEKITSYEKWKPFFPSLTISRQYHTAEEYIGFLQKTGLKFSLREFKERMYYASKEDLIAYIRPLVTFIDHLSVDLQQSFIEDLVNYAFDNNPSMPNGDICISHNMIEVIASRD